MTDITMENRKVELLAPAGSFQSVKAAVNAGADAVYMGGIRFGARAYAESAESTEEDMVMEAIHYCHLFSVKLYMTVNILFKESELPALRDFIKPYYVAGVDGLIMQDIGAAKMIQHWFPDLPVHASTQMTITSSYGVEMAKRLGMTRVVLSRELSLSEIKQIYEKTHMELEAFCHGAMCYSYSGACFMSSLLGGRSGNRGRCAGTCRLEYQAAGKQGYYLSMKDMETVALLPEMISAGVYSFKIEGRMKSPVYTAGVAAIYRKYLDLAMASIADEKGVHEEYRVDPQDIRILHAIYDRGGVTEYLTRHNGQEMIAVSEKKFREENIDVTDYIKKNFIEKDRQLPVKARLSLHQGEKARLMFYLPDGTSAEVSSDTLAEKAGSSPLTKEVVFDKLIKTGGTAFSIMEPIIEMDEDCFLPVSAINRLRRDAIQKLTDCILKKSERVINEW